MKIKDSEDGLSFQYTPKACTNRKVRILDDAMKPTGATRDVPASFSGHVVLKRIGLMRRLKLMPKVDAARSIDSNGLAAAAVAIEETMDLWGEVNLKHLKSEKEFKNVAELMLDPRCDEIVIECALGHIDGFVTPDGEPEGN